jgi:acyl-[acyl-carrier-protein]-phospholipid O-acyltransferase / long-chain-fatty-acid--[acyl-carrier-protein] ligase
VESLIRWALRTLFRIRIEGDTRSLQRGRTLVISNHDSLLDAVLLGWFLPGAPTIVATREALRDRFVRLLMRRVPYVVLDPAQPLGLKHLIEQVRNGQTIAIFPQGRASTTGTVMKVYDAAGIIAARCDAQIVPVHIHGTINSRWSMVNGHHPRRWFPRVTLQIHDAVRLPDVQRLAPRDRRRRLADEVLTIMQRVRFQSRPRTTLFEAFLDAVSLHGRNTPIIEDVRQQPESYGELLRSSLALSRLFSRVAVKDEIVGVMMPNLSATLAVVLGMVAIQRVPAMLNYTAGLEAVANACLAAGIRKIVTSRRFVQAARLDVSASRLASLELVYLEDLRKGFGAVDKLWLLFRAMPWPRSIVRANNADDLALVLFTSGSESRPKGVALSHDSILASIAQMRAVIDFGRNDKYLNALPMYHVYGLVACTLMPLLSGTRLFLYTNPLHYRFIPELAYTKDCTYIFGTSTFLGHYARHAHPYDFYRVRVVVCGGEKLNPEVAELWLRKFGLRIMEGYGATECGPAMSLNTPLRYKQGTVGLFLPALEYRLVAVPGIERGGALHVRSPNLMKGYYFYEQPSVIQPPRSEVGTGWYNTGDIVDVDDEGYVTILGRVKRFAKIAGEMVSLELVERIAYEAAPAYKHAATVEQIAGRGESTVLFTTDPQLDRIALQKAARRLGAQDLAVGRRIIRVPYLPLLGSGKTDYVTLKQQHLAESD